MRSLGDGNGWIRFERDFRAWAAREPLTEPRKAARLVIEKLPERRRPIPLWRLAAAAVMLVGLGTTLWLARDGRPVASSVGTVVPSPALPEDVVVWWIEPDTPVYFVLGQGGHGMGGER
jgi:hypothetical protein